MHRITHSEAETFALSAAFGRSLKNGAVVCLFGELGAGKTTFMKGLAYGAGEISPEKVTSPTFAYLNIYEGKKIIYHFDLYRLRDADEFLSAGFEEFLYSEGICCIEWCEKIKNLLPDEVVRIYLKHIDATTREITVDRRAD